MMITNMAADSLRMAVSPWTRSCLPVAKNSNVHHDKCSKLQCLGSSELHARSFFRQRRSLVLPSVLRNGSGFRLHSSNVDSAELQIEALRKMRVAAIKMELDALGVFYGDCFEKEELVKRLAAMKHKKRLVSMPVDKAITQLPMRKLKSTVSSPKEYIIIPLTFGNQGTFDFLLDTGSSTTLVSPFLAHNKLGIPPGSGQLSRGLGGMGDGGLDMRQVALPAVSINGHPIQPVKGIIMDLASTRLPSFVAGIVGINVLSQFDVEFDFVKERIKLYKVGAVERGDCDTQGLQKLVMAPIQYSLPGLQVKMGGGKVQSAIIDLGSSLSVTTPDVAKSASATLEKLGLSGIGVDGQQMAFSKTFIDVTIPIEQNRGSTETLLFEKVAFAVGNLPAMQAINCNIILGLNVFCNTRFVLSMTSRTAYIQTYL